MRALLYSLAFLLCLVVGSPVRAGDSEDRQRAAALISQNKFAEAVPILRELVQAHPQEGRLWTSLGFALHTLAETLSDPVQRKKTRKQSREALLKAKALGVHDQLLEAILAATPADGSSGEITLSQNPLANQYLADGQTAFAKGQFDLAERGYQAAFACDPKLYEAPLYAGDSCYRAEEFGRAQEWFAKAVAVDPERETAYRYWGDMLLKQDKHAEAKIKFIEAVLCEPYGRFSWRGLINWAASNKVKVGHPRFPGLDDSVIKMEQGKATVTLPAGDKDAGILVMSYGLARAAWHGKNPSVQRHSLAEEAAALNATAQIAKELEESGKLTSKPAWLGDLLRLQQLDLMEAYVLLGRPDRGIAQDYPAYRAAHRAQLVQYLEEVYLHP